MDPGGADGHALWTLSWQSVEVPAHSPSGRRPYLSDGGNRKHGLSGAVSFYKQLFPHPACPG